MDTARLRSCLKVVQALGELTWLPTRLALSLLQKAQRTKPVIHGGSDFLHVTCLLWMNLFTLSIKAVRMMITLPYWLGLMSQWTSPILIGNGRCLEGRK